MKNKKCEKPNYGVMCAKSERERIVKALEYCIFNDYNRNSTKCKECPIYNGGSGCIDELKQAALAFIKLQEQMIKELTEENKKLKVEIDFSKELRKKIEAEFLLMHCKYGSALQTTREKTVLKMQERLREYFPYDADSGLYVVLDQIAKEMLEG